MKAWVSVKLKQDVLDPQGEAIRKACLSLGHEGVAGVRQGKLFEIELDTRDEASARALVEELADKLLANPVIEDFSVERIEP
jgi:phosphoribosylformylglycinamidine synthase